MENSCLFITCRNSVNGNGKPVVISTYTNYLADKIVDEELKNLNSILGTKLKATVLKGREQYISLGKFEELLTISEQSYDETFTIMQILVWLTETSTGDLEGLNVSGGGQLFVDRIRKGFERMAPDEQVSRLPQSACRGMYAFEFYYYKSCNATC